MTLKMLVGVRLIAVSPILSPRTSKGAGKPSKVLPNTTEAKAIRLMKMPRVTMTALISGPVSTGRTTTRSRTAPSRKPEIRAATRPSQ